MPTDAAVARHGLDVGGSTEGNDLSGWPWHAPCSRGSTAPRGRGRWSTLFQTRMAVPGRRAVVPDRIEALLGETVRHFRNLEDVVTDGGSSTLSGAFAGLLREVTGLVRAEMNLAKTEMTGKAFRLGKEAGFLAGGAALAYAGGLAIVAALVRIFEAFLPRWLAALAAGLLAAAVGAALATKGLKAIQQTELAPEHTIDTLKGLGE